MKNLDSDKMLEGPAFAGNHKYDSAKWIEIDGTMKYEVKFRFQRGGLRESLATTIKVYSRKQLIDILNSKNDWLRKYERLKFYHIGLDPRTKWNSYYVLASRRAEQFEVVGISNGKFDKEKSVSESISEFRQSLKPTLLKFEKFVLNPLGFKLKEKYR